MLTHTDRYTLNIADYKILSYMFCLKRCVQSKVVNAVFWHPVHPIIIMFYGQVTFIYTDALTCSVPFISIK